jgi:hypothetical protein
MSPGVRDPLLAGLADPPEYYVPGRGPKRDYAKLSHDELVETVNVLHGFTRQLVREKDDIRRVLTATAAALRRELRRERIKSRVMATLITASLASSALAIVKAFVVR